MNEKNNKKNNVRRFCVAGFFILSLFFAVETQAAVTGDYTKATSSVLAAFEWNNLLHDFLSVNGGRIDGSVGINTAATSTYALDILGSIRATNLSGSYTGLLNAGNVSMGDFGSNSGGGNYTFPGNVGIGGDLNAANRVNLGLLAPTASFHAGTIGVMIKPSTGDRAIMELHSPTEGAKALIQAVDGTGLFIQSLNSLPTIFSNNYAGSYLRIDGSAVGNGIRFSATGATTPVGLGLNGNVLQVTDGASGFGTLAAGSIGVGTTNPNGQLDLYKASGINIVSGNLLLTRYWNTGIDTRASSVFHYTDGTNDKIAFGVSGDGGSYIQPNQISQAKMVIQANGNIGIGTTNPQSVLDVIAPANSFVSVGGAGLSVGQYAGIHFGYRENNTSYRKSAIVFERTDNSGGGGNAAGKIHILNGPALGGGSATLADAKLTIGELGNVGIGTSTPAAKLDVNGLIKMRNFTITQPEDVINKSYLDSAMTSTTATIITQIATSSLWQGTLTGNIWSNNTGNVGIGTLTPGAAFGFGPALEIAGSRATLALTSTGSLSTIRFKTSTADSEMHVNFDDPTGSLSFGAYKGGFKDVLTIKGSGNVGIGVTNPAAALDVYSKVKITSGGTIYNTDSARWLDMTGTLGDSLKVSADIYSTAGNLKIAGTGNSYVMGSLGVGVAAPSASLHVLKNATNYSQPAVLLTGKSLAGTGDDNNGFGLYLSYNLSGNRQFVFADTETGAGVRFVNSSIDGFNKTSQTRQDLQIGTETNGAHIGGGGVVGATQFSVSNLTGTASKIVTEFKGAAAQSGNYFNISSSGATADILAILSNGNVGINTSNPGAYKLNVNGDTNITGNLNVTGTITASGLTGITVNAGNVSSGEFGKNTAGGNYIFGATVPGNVGIGTITPRTKLHVVSDATNTSQPNGIQATNDVHTGLFLGSSGNTINEKYGMQFGGWSDYSVGGIFGVADSTLSNSSGDLTFDMRTLPADAALTEVMRIQHEGNVGIGTTAPGQKLDVAGNINVNTNGQGALITTFKGANSDGNNLFVGNGGQNNVGEAGSTYKGSNNAGFGNNAGLNNTTGYNNLFVGAGAGQANTTGFQNTALGDFALYSNQTAGWNTAFGDSALYSATGGTNTAVGSYSLYANATGTANVANGISSLRFNTFGSKNVSNGAWALYRNTTGNDNTAVGYYSLGNSVDGNGNTAYGSGALYSTTNASGNVSVGYASLWGNTTGAGNTALGYNAGRYQADGTTVLQTATSSVYIGYKAMGLNNSDSNSIVIGSNAKGIGANTVVLGDDTITKTALKGSVGIGTTAPVGALDVYGLIKMRNFTITQPEDVINKAYLDAVVAGTSSVPTVGYWTATGANISNANTGNVGIGTTNPLYKLDVSGTINATGNITSDSSMLAQAAWFNQMRPLTPSGPLTFRNYGGVTNMTVLDSGNVGIGVTNPAAALDIYSKVKVTSGGTIYNTDSARWLDMTGTLGDSLKISADIYSTAGNLKIAGVGNSYVMGSLGVGMTNPAYKLDVTGGANVSGSLSVASNLVLTLPSNNPEVGPWNPIWNTVGSSKPLYFDEEFSAGNNSVNVYNNSGGVGVIITRLTGQTGIPNSTGSTLKISYDGVNPTSPGYGGFYLSIPSAANRTFVQRFRAKLPVGKTLILTENPQGTNNTSYWLTNNVGTGKWEDYIRVSHAGNTGTFSSGGHIYVTGGAGAFDWYLASANIYEVNTPIIASPNTWVSEQTFSGGAKFPGSGIWNTTGNVGINITNPGAYKLNVNGDTNITGNLNVTGTITAAGLTGITVNAANVSSGAFGANTSGGNYSFPGNLGVGATNSAGKFSVASTGIAGAAASVASWDSRFSTFGPNVGNNTGAALALGYDTTADASAIYSIAPNIAWKPLYFNAASYNFNIGGGNTKVTIDSSGDVGIGTTNPGAQLVLATTQSNSSDYNYLTFRNSSSGYGTWGFLKKGNNDLSLNYGTNSDTPSVGTSMTWQYAGNVGINTTNPGYKLQVDGTIFANTANSLLVPATAGGHAVYTDLFNSYSPSSHGTNSWFRNSSNLWTFQGGSTGEDWTQTAQLYLNPVGAAGADDKLIELGQRQSNNPAGDYKGVRIVHYTGNAVQDGYLQAGNATFSGTVTAGGFSGPLTGTLNATNVSSGQFGLNTGGGTFNFGGQTTNGFGTYFTNPSSHYTPATNMPQVLIRQDDAETTVANTQHALTIYNDNGGLNTYSTMSFASREAIAGVNSVSLAGISGWKISAGTSGGWSQGGLKFWVKDYANINEAMSIIQNGYVGIGTSAPGTYRLSIVQPPVTGNNGLKVVAGNSATDYVTYFTGNDGIAAQTMVMQQNGNVGIGMTNPSQKLNVTGSALLGSSGSLYFNDTSTAIGIPGANTLAFTTSGAERLRIDNLGNIGIGTTNPGVYKLKVVGNMAVTGTMESQTGSDFAEEFATSETLEPGTVVVMSDNGYKSVKPSNKSYDNTVVGIVSNNPSIITGKVESEYKAIVAMMGVVKVKVVNANGHISKGDMLTTSNQAGYAMKADSSKPGTIIGKALESLDNQTGEINVLVNLQ